MATKSLKTRIQNKHDTEANWAKATTFRPLAGELIIYDKDSNNAKPRFKVGDGTTTVTNLPFVAIDYDSRITSLESTVNGLGTAAQKDVGFFATAAQGTKADNAVPKTRKVNNRALSADITLGASDVGVTESAFPGLKKTGTITEIKMNSASKGTSGVVDLGTVLTAHQNIKILNTNNTTSQTASASEALSGSGTINLHKVAKTGNYNDLSNRPTIPTVNNGMLTIQKNGTTVQTFSANQSGNVTANITVPTKASDVNALSLDGGTINKSKTVKMDASANSDGANLKWGTVNSKNPYIGYASDQVDGTFVVGSLLGTTYASGLAIGGGSGNLLWKGAKVATTSDIPAAVTESTVSGWGFTKNTGTVTSVAVKMNGTTKGTVTSSGTIDLGTVITNHQDISGLVPKYAFFLSGTTLTITI